ncbi:MAG: DUF2283 domain-containing protein [Deltaproteobacteria bacterium]|nr:DUF2283 domain-containing protein [Deltaproteobacteria bacterium]
MSKEVISDVFKATPYLLKMPANRMWIDYDQEADVLYISFKRPQKATDSEMLENGILVRYRGGQVVGLTILEASKRDKKNAKRKALKPPFGHLSPMPGN